MAPSAPFVVCSGLTTVDVAHLVDHVPSSNVKVASQDFFLAAGGPATNGAVAAAACGSRARLVTALPSHPLSDLIRADLADCGVDLHVADGSPTGPPLTAAIMVTRATGERAVVSPTTAAVDVPHTPDNFDASALVHGATAVLIDGYHRHLAVPIAQAAREAGIPVVLDAGSHKPYTDDLLAVTDVAVVSDDFTFPGGGSPEATLAALVERGVKAAVVTRGGGPMLVQVGTHVTEVPVAPVEVVDTLGAGDVLHGALAHRLAAWGLDLDRLPADLEWASRVVAVSLRTFGTRAWLNEALPQ
ncbi:PfkB family carbohydrate kinase [Demequina globuliformis]|uniref:PfkB family carbohydrate kinase n=1 Tax=Demequina globuliformis TaxID=676202 RepID=UPI000781787A|nr:PfkB family carbohydrate kinase [Demequina globuliformis]